MLLGSACVIPALPSRDCAYQACITLHGGRYLLEGHEVQRVAIAIDEDRWKESFRRKPPENRRRKVAGTRIELIGDFHSKQQDPTTRSSVRRDRRGGCPMYLPCPILS